MRLCLSFLASIATFPVSADPVQTLITQAEKLHRVRIVDHPGDLSRETRTYLGGEETKLMINGRVFVSIVDEEIPFDAFNKCDFDFCPILFDGEYQVDVSDYSSSVSIVYKIWNVRFIPL